MQVNIQCKLDGISLRATYQDGKLVELVTRGNGVQGDDITEHAAHIPSLPKTITVMGEVHGRGEGVLYEADFASHFGSQKNSDGTRKYANSRNTTSGLLKGRSTPADLSHIHFVAYKYTGPGRPDSEHRVITGLAALGFEVPALNELVTTEDQATKIYEDYDKPNGRRESLPYKTDGLVLNVDDINLQAKIPDQGNRPGYAVAVKPSPKAAVSKVIGIEWSMGLSGAYTPVALVEPCELDGTTCRRVNMFNLDFLTTWVEGGYLESQKAHVKGGFGIGATILIIRTGDVLPYIKDVMTPAPILA